MITGILLLLADKSKASNKNINYKDALLIGFAQAIAIIPGISRSGATISTSVLLGIDKEASARFSFLMVVPLIFGKILQDFFSGNIVYEDTIFTSLLIGFFAALITGFFACKLMINIVKKSKLKYFSIYCFLGFFENKLLSRNYFWTFLKMSNFEFLKKVFSRVDQFWKS